MTTERRLIDAIEEEMPYCPDTDYEIGYQNGLTMAKAIALKLDAVEVVRCKDCVNWHEDTLFCDYMPYGESQERVNWYGDDFCSYGERRTDNG